ncbi:MAG TPA: cupin domain-containing protein [Lacunisphaera sp.]|nr:cupin domain-containing protein [Lacunisphaera sp.]
MEKINLAAKLSLFSEHWTPKVIAGLNGQHVKLVKARGVFPWHHHEHEDELFLVVRGSFRLEWKEPVRDAPRKSARTAGASRAGRTPFRARSAVLREGELIVVPRGVEHRPVAKAEVSLLLFEPASTVNTGSAGGDKTVTRLDWI